ncbi:aldehyde-activating protein [Sphingomonas koreensis]|nr:aldehyde-activating protein [Sphingomonas koreensis]
MIAGGCRCGAIRYAVTTKRMPPVYCCHCRDCQTWSASAFSEQAVVRDGALRITIGTPTEYHFANPSGSISRQYVCDKCHTRLYNTNSARPGIVLIRAGTLDASDTLRPVAHIWTKRKQPWIVLPEGVPSFAESAPAATFAAILQQAAGDPE